MRNHIFAAALIAGTAALPLPALAQSSGTVGVGGPVVGVIESEHIPTFRRYVVEERVPSYAVPDRVVVGTTLPEAGVIYYDADGSGAGEMVAFAQVGVGTALTNSDFLITGDGSVAPTEGDDILVGTAGDDGAFEAPFDLLGGNDTFDLLPGGSDWVNGGAGNDTLIARAGSIGSDQFNGGTGLDTVDFSLLTSSQPVTTSGAGSYSGELWVNLRIGDDYGLAAANTENFILGAGDDIVSFAPISGWGQVVNQGVTVDGGLGADTITGSNFADTIIGGAGGDVLSGGALADAFVYEALSDSQYLTSWDRIADFQQGIDLIDLSAIDANSVGGTDNDAFAYIGYNAAFTGVAGELAIMGPEYTAAANSYAVLADLDGDGQGDLRIDISSPTAPTVDDLFL